MSIGYSCLWSVCNKDTGAPHVIEHTNCWASVFGDYTWSTRLKGSYKEANSLVAWFRIDPNDITIPQANWYLRRAIIPAIPERCKEAIHIYRLFTKTYHKDISKEKRYNMYEGGEAQLPWIKIRIELDKICANDLFMLLTLLRNPQEFPRDVVSCHSVWKLGLSVDLSFLIGHMSTLGPSGHAALGAWLLHHLPTKEEMESFSVAKSWENQRANEKTWIKETTRTTTLNSSFQKWQKTPPAGGRPLYAVSPAKWRDLCDNNDIASKKLGFTVNGIQADMLATMGVLEK